MTANQASVLVVGDEPPPTDSYAEWLDAEYAVRAATSAADALAVLDDAPVDVVLLDGRLPDPSSETVLDAVEERGVDCRVALLAADDPDTDAPGRGYDLRVEGPVTDAERLRAAVATLCRRDDYDDKMRRYFALASERGTLEAEKSREDLDDSVTYRELVGELDALRDEVETTMTRLDNADYRADFRDRRESRPAGSTAPKSERETPDAEASEPRSETERE